MAAIMYMCLIVVVSLYLLFNEVGSLSGGYTQRNPADTDVKNAAMFAVQWYNNNTAGLNLFQLIQIKDAKSQVVAGTNYFLVLIVVETTCMKNTMNPCIVGPSTILEVLSCEFAIYQSPPPEAQYSVNSAAMNSQICKIPFIIRYTW